MRLLSGSNTALVNFSYKKETETPADGFVANTVIDGVLLLWWQDKYPDTNLLDVSEVELHDLQMFEDNPVVVVKFSCQQIRQGSHTHTYGCF